MTLPTLTRYVAREILAHFFGVTVIVLGISVLRRLSSLLAEAVDGTLPSDVVFELLSLRTAVSLPSLIPAVLFLSIVLALGRLHQDREVAALEASGIASLRLAQPVLLLAAALAVVVAGLSFVTTPCAAARFQQVRQSAIGSLEVGALSPRRFYEIGPEGNQVFFAESGLGNGEMTDVFVQDWKDGALAIFSAAAASERIDPATGARTLELRGGYRYDLRPDGERHEITEYKDLTIRMQDAAPAGETLTGARNLPTAALLGSPDLRHVAELEWRLSMPLSALFLALLAIPLGRVEPGQGKYARLFVAVLLYLVYHQLLVTSRHWVSSGKLAPLPGLFWVHGVCLLVAVLLITLQSRGGLRWPSLARPQAPTALVAPARGADS